MQVNSYGAQMVGADQARRLMAIANDANAYMRGVNAEFNALALVPIPEEGRSFRPMRSDRSITNK